MAALSWIQWTEPGRGENHPSGIDIVNRPLKELLANSGYAATADSPSFLSGANLITAQPVVVDGTTTPPAAPAEGDLYLVDVGATGVWNGHDKQIARAGDTSGATWTYFTPEEGWEIYVQSDNYCYRFDGVNWTATLGYYGLTVTGGPFTVNSPTQLIDISGRGINLTTVDAGYGLDFVSAGYVSVLANNNIDIGAGQDGTGTLSLSGNGGASSIDLNTKARIVSSLAIELSATAIKIGDSSADLITGSGWFSRDLYPQDPTAGGPWSLGTFTNRWSRVQLATGATVWRAPTTVTPVGNGFALGSFTRGSLNWSFEQFNAEGGASSGSDLILTRWSDAGVPTVWLTVTRSSGAYTIAGDGTYTGNLIPSANNTYDLGSSSFKWRTGYFGTSVISPIVDSGSATDLLLKRNNVTQLTLASLSATFAGALAVTAATSIGTNLVVGQVSAPNIDEGIRISSVPSTGINVYGLRVNFDYNSTTTGEGRTLFVAFRTAAAAFTMTNGFGLYVNTPVIGAGSAVTTGHGIFVSAQTWTGSTTAYGIRMGNTSGASTNYSILTGSGTTGAGWHQFGDIVGIGIGVNQNHLLAIWGLASGSGPNTHPGTATTVNGITVSYTIPSTATTSATYLQYQARTAAAAFTIGTLIGFYAQAPVIGAGSSVTALYGMRIDNQGNAGITNSYGLLINSQSGSATNSWAIVTGTGRHSFGATLEPGSNNSFDLGLVATTWRTGYFGTSVISPILDSGAATDLLLKRNGTTQLTLAASAATFVGTATATEFLAPSIDSGSATDLLLQRNNVTQLTLGSSLATFVGQVVLGNTTANQLQISYDGSNLWKFNVTSVAGLELLPTGTTFNLAIFAAGSYGSGKGVIFVANATTVPSTNPTGGAIIYVEGGAIKARGSAGTVTTLAPA